MSAGAEPRKQAELEGLGSILFGLGAFALGCWLVPTVICLLHGGTMAPLSIPAAVASLGRLVGDSRFADPASAYPPAARAAMPVGWGWWLGAAWCVAVLGAAIAAFMRHVEPEIARERLGRRAYDWRGSRPRPWARPRDLRRSDGARRGWSVGRLDGRPLWTDEEAHIAVIAPTRAGKTTRCVIPWLLEHDGPAIVTSTKRDVLDATREQRARIGSVWIFDPFGEDCSSWTPLVGCTSWSYALRQAQWLADASSDGNNEIARFWRGEAAKLVAPLLHAAALGRLEMTQVLQWVDSQNFAEPRKHLLSGQAHAATQQLNAIDGLDDRNKGTTLMSAAAMLAAYRFPEVQAMSGDDITPGGVSGEAGAHALRGRGRAPSAPAGPSRGLSDLVHGQRGGGSRCTNAMGRTPTPGAPRRSGQRRPIERPATDVVPRRWTRHPLRTVWQSIAQLEERHGVAAHTVMANSTAKLFMGPIGDDHTRRAAEGMLRRATHRSRQQHEDADVSARSLQLLKPGRAIAQLSDRPPAVVDLTPYWQR